MPVPPRQLKRQNNWRRSKRSERSQAGVCRCGQKSLPDRRLCEKCRSASNKKYHARVKADPAHRETLRRRGMESYARLRADVFAAYGTKCVCCNETAPEFLTIDHIEPAGKRVTTNRCGKGLYSWLRQNNYPEGFRVLCMNCNFAIGHHGQCPHEKTK